MNPPDPPLALDPAQRQRTPPSTSEQQFRAAFDYALDGMMLINDAGQFVHINRAMYTLFAVTPDMLLGRTIFDVRGILPLGTWPKPGHPSGTRPLPR